MLLRTALISLERNAGSGHVELQDVAPGICQRSPFSAFCTRSVFLHAGGLNTELQV